MSCNSLNARWMNSQRSQSRANPNRPNDNPKRSCCFVSPELLASQTTTNLLSLLLAPVNTYASALTLLAVPSYQGLLSQQPSATRVSIGQAIVSSILKSNTCIACVEDVNGILILCQDLVRDDGGDLRSHPANTSNRAPLSDSSSGLAEEQGWLARIIHLFSSDDTAEHVSVSLSSLGFNSPADWFVLRSNAAA